jgi:8-oxo-dGTP pyrophosphatase MutT (NUDIX family)
LSVIVRDLITARLAPPPPAGHAPAAPPPRGDYDLTPELRDSLPRDRPLRHAAVLVPIVDRPEGATVLLTQRTKHLSNHAGQVSFPGGRVEPTDSGPVEAALREAEEEIGLAPHFVEVVGRLDEYETGTGFHITPVVGLVRPGFTLVLDAFEVEAAFEVPLDHVLDIDRHERRSGIWQGIERHYWVIPHEERFIWGATAGMLVDLARKLAA